MESLIFSLNATVPVFMVILLGYILKRTGMFNEQFINTANKFNFKITLPVLLFQDISTTNIRDVFDLKYILYCMIVTTIVFWGLWGLSKLFFKNKDLIGEFVQASFRGSAAVLGIALIYNLYGNAGMIPLMIIGAVPLFNVYSVLVLTFESKEKQEKTIGMAFIEICKNPIIIAICIGLFISFVEIDFPIMVDSTISSIAKIASPFALLGIGAAFEGKKALSILKPTIVASVIKLLILPILFLPVAIWLGFTTDKLIAALIMLGAPATPSCFIMARNMGHNGVLTSSIVVLTTILSAFTLTAIIFVLRFFGLV